MTAVRIKFDNVDQYIAGFPKDIQKLLQLDKSLPFKLISEIVKFRVIENLEKAKAKTKAKTKK
jgi:hypothetical protein